MTWKGSGKTLCEILTVAGAIPLPMVGPRVDRKLSRRGSVRPFLQRDDSRTWSRPLRRDCHTAPMQASSSPKTAACWPPACPGIQRLAISPQIPRLEKDGVTLRRRRRRGRETCAVQSPTYYRTARFTLDILKFANRKRLVCPDPSPVHLAYVFTASRTDPAARGDRERRRLFRARVGCSYMSQAWNVPARGSRDADNGSGLEHIRDAAKRNRRGTRQSSRSRSHLTALRKIRCLYAINLRTYWYANSKIKIDI